MPAKTNPKQAKGKHLCIILTARYQPIQARMHMVPSFGRDRMLYDNLGRSIDPWEPIDQSIATKMSAYWVNFKSR